MVWLLVRHVYQSSRVMLLKTGRYTGVEFPGWEVDGVCSSLGSEASYESTKGAHSNSRLCLGLGSVQGPRAGWSFRLRSEGKEFEGLRHGNRATRNKEAEGRMRRTRLCLSSPKMTKSQGKAAATGQ